MANDDVRDFLTALSAAGVKFVVVGAYALAAHGRLRATGDIDILLQPNRANAKRLEKAIRAFSGTSLEYFDVSVEELSRAEVGFFMGIEPDRIDVLTRIAGVGFERAWSGCEPAVIEGVSTRVLGFDELVAAKRASIRRRPQGSFKAKQDESDLAWLLAERARRSKRRR